MCCPVCRRITQTPQFIYLYEIEYNAWCVVAHPNYAEPAVSNTAAYWREIADRVADTMAENIANTHY